MLYFGGNQLTFLDLSNCPVLEHFSYIDNPLVGNIKFPPGWKERAWKKIRDNTKPQITGLEKLVDTSDLDNWVENYDINKIGDVEYHRICGEGGYKNLETPTLDNLGNKVIGRKLIVLSRLLVSQEDFASGKLQGYEEYMNRLADQCQMCNAMLPGGNWTQEQQQEAVNKALNGDTELLSKIADLPYIYPWVKKIIHYEKQIRELEGKVSQLENRQERQIETRTETFSRRD